MPGDWRADVREELPGFGLGELDDGDSISVTFTDEGEVEETSNGPALVIGVRVREAPDDLTDMNGKSLEAGEDYRLFTSSNRLKYELAEHADSLEGEEVTIAVAGSGFNRFYNLD